MELFLLSSPLLTISSQNGIYEGIPHGNVKLTYSESFLMLNLIHSEFSCGQSSVRTRSVVSAGANSRKLDKQRVLPKKEVRLLTKLRLLGPSSI